MLLWLWYKLAALIRPLAWELPHAAGAALKRKTKEKERDGEASDTVLSLPSTTEKKNVVPDHHCGLYELCPQADHLQIQKVGGKFSSLLILR